MSFNFLHLTDWHRGGANTVVDPEGRANRLAALDELRRRLRTRHYSYRTDCSYADCVRRFFAYAAERQQLPHPRIESEPPVQYGQQRAMPQGTTITVGEGSVVASSMPAASRSRA